MTIHIAVISDSHAGHKLGLCPQGIRLQEIDRQGNVYDREVVLNDVQLYLENITRQALNYAANLDGDLVVIHLGEQVHGNKIPEQILSTRLSDQIEIGYRNLERWARLPNCTMVRACFGTGWHEYGEGSAAAIICQRLQDAYPGIDVRAVYHGLLELDGALVDYQHHGPHPGSRNWLTGNVARYHLRSRMLDDIIAGNRPANLYLYGHYHTPVSEVLEVNGYESRLIIMPSMCGMGDYAVRATRSAWKLVNGYAMFAIEDGAMSRPHWIKEQLDIRTKESYGRGTWSESTRDRQGKSG